MVRSNRLVVGTQLGQYKRPMGRFCPKVAPAMPAPALLDLVQRRRAWQERFRKVQAEAKPGDPAESGFLARYNGCLDQALQIGADRFSAAS
jgi:hypothetical protein